MDKPITFNEWLGTQGNIVLLHANCCRIAFEGGQQSMQAKVEELKATIKGNHGRIAELERLNRVKAQAIIDLHQEITELKASHHGEVIGHEVHFKKIKQERDELQTLYIQQGINMLKMQKRVDEAIRLLVEAELYQSEPNIDLAVKALKGGGE
ncbi:hypothetical protein MSG94_06545 [Acinetobacter baumannii]|nr:hypothetical protein [Acinetobacter baumannii]MDV4278010.1 hypothetical protein [Acinetobacter baumannii]